MKRGHLLVALALSACSAERPALEDLRHDGYRSLEVGDLRSAGRHAEEGRKRALESDLPTWAWAFRVLEAEVLVGQRRNAEALALLEAGLGAHTTVDLVRVRALMTRGFARCLEARSAEDFRRAEGDLEEAARLAPRVASREIASEVTLRLGTCRVVQRDYGAAEDRFRAVLAIARRENLSFVEAHAVGMLGLVCVRTQRYDEASDWLRRALALASALKAENSRVKVLNNLGWCYFRLGDYEQALPLLLQSEELAGTLDLRGDRLTALNTIGQSLYKQGELGRSTEYYERALRLARELKDDGSAAQLLANLARVAVEREQYDQAEARTREALDLKSAVDDRAGRQHSLRALADIRAARGRRAEAEALYRGVIASADTSTTLQWETRAALAALHAQSGDRPAAEAEFRRAFALMETMRSSLHEPQHNMAFFSSLRRFHEDYVLLLAGAGRGLEALEVADRGRARLLRERLGRGGGHAVNADGFRRLARELDSVLLAYWTAPGRSLLWVVTPRSIDMHVLPGEKTLRRDVESHQSAILRSRDPVGDGMPEGAALWQTLVAPAVHKVPPGTRVIVVPDGPLHGLNFETLVAPGPRPHYWIEDVTVMVAPSLGLLSAPPHRRRAESRILVIGNPVPPSPEFPPLPHAAREVDRIGGLFDPSLRAVYSGGDAQPSAYRGADPARFTFIHFAAHAFANRESPLDSAVVLSGHDGGYKLYAREIATVPITAEMVTLSACRSAGSRAFAGEGLVGLAWTFLVSGASNVVGGLWNVEDASTADLMEGLYGGVRAGRAPGVALRESKLRLLRSGTAYRKPFYWAPFVVFTRQPK